MSLKNRYYSELVTIPSFLERFNYLKLGGKVGEETFGFKRYLNQEFYTSKEWLSFRDLVILRDAGQDLACEGFDIYGPMTIHHINPITIQDLINRSPVVFDLENVITTSAVTHRAIHYGSESLLVTEPVERTPNDTCPWRK